MLINSNIYKKNQSKLRKRLIYFMSLYLILIRYIMVCTIERAMSVFSLWLMDYVNINSSETDKQNYDQQIWEKNTIEG